MFDCMTFFIGVYLERILEFLLLEKNSDIFTGVSFSVLSPGSASLICYIS